jgi:hypothetical protein
VIYSGGEIVKAADWKAAREADMAAQKNIIAKEV